MFHAETAKMNKNKEFNEHSLHPYLRDKDEDEKCILLREIQQHKSLTFQSLQYCLDLMHALEGKEGHC